MEIRTISLQDETAFRAFQDLLLEEKQEGNPFVETQKVTDFASFVNNSKRLETETTNPDWSTQTTYFAFDKGEILGKISCRWEIDKGDLARAGGHIGYVTSPKYRQQGIMSKLLQFALAQYQERGITKVLITANEDNSASRRTIEKVGGSLENLIMLEGDYPSSHMAGQTIARYWIELENKK